jgi:hypothetical protein
MALWRPSGTVPPQLDKRGAKQVHGEPRVCYVLSGLSVVYSGYDKKSSSE